MRLTNLFLTHDCVWFKLYDFQTIKQNAQLSDTQLTEFNCICRFKEGPVSYIENTDALNQALDRSERPISQKEIQLLVDEISLGKSQLYTSWNSSWS